MLSTALKNNVLNELAQRLRGRAADIIAANEHDVSRYSGQDESMFDRLKVDENKVASMVAAVEAGIQLKDPENLLLYSHEHDNGLHIENRTVPFGYILIIYESRPDVTIEAALTAFKAGNKIYLKGGKEARETNLLLTSLWHEALTAHDVSTDYVQYLDYNRDQTQKLISENSLQIDLIIPRGGEGLIQFVRQNTSIPVIVSGRGNNFVFVDKNCDFDMATEIILNGKSRISVCNAVDKVLIHRDTPDLLRKMQELIFRLKESDIEVLGDVEMNGQFEQLKMTNDEEILYEEFLAAKIFLLMVNDTDEAITKINKYSGGHSNTIVTSNLENAARFLNEVDSAAVYHNASTRFTDGGQFGFGAEMAISTQKVHFRGPVAIEQLVTNKWFVYGNGQVR